MLLVQDLVREIALFSALSSATQERVAAACVQQRYARGQLIILAGEPILAAYFVSRGEVRAYRLSPSGRQQVLAQLGPGEGFNLVPVFQEAGLNHATVEAVGDALVLSLPHERLIGLVQECPDLALALLTEFADKLDHLTNLVEDLALRTVRVRLSRFLLEQAGEGKVAHGWTQDEIAAHLGTVRDMVGRTLRSFADAGLLRLDRQRIVLIDREGLQAEAEA